MRAAAAVVVAVTVVAEAAGVNVRLQEFTPRPDWAREIEGAGLSFHTPDGVPYWIDHRAFAFTADQVERIRDASDELYGMYLEAAAHVVAHDLFDELGIPAEIVPAVRRSWAERHPAIYGRFDFALNAAGVPKLLEFNSDTPTSLIESASIQESWLARHREFLPAGARQYNSLESNLTAAWRRLSARCAGDAVYFSYMRNSFEDRATAGFMRECAERAGLRTRSIAVEDIALAGSTFLDLEDRPITFIYKLYPWEMVWQDKFGAAFMDLPGAVEPLWKVILQSKGMLPILWQLFPNHPNLLRTSPRREDFDGDVVEKPRFSRLGGNVTITSDGETISSGGFYDQNGFVYQEYTPLPHTPYGHALIGSWIADGRASGISIRESDGKITDNFSRFIPHFITR